MLAVFSNMYETRTKETDQGPWHEAELQDFLSASIRENSHLPPLCLFIDALDEAGDEAAADLVEYFERLLALSRGSGADSSICFSCRH